MKRCFHQDVTSEARWVEVVTEVEKRFGRLTSWFQMPASEYRCRRSSTCRWRTGAGTAINLDGVFLSVKHCLPPCAGPAAARSS